jgi:hypothetical protein
MSKEQDVTNKYTVIEGWQLRDERVYDDLQVAREAAIAKVEEYPNEKYVVVEMIEMASQVKPPVEVEVGDVKARVKDGPKDDSEVVCNAAHVPDASS